MSRLSVASLKALHDEKNLKVGAIAANVLFKLRIPANMIREGESMLFMDFDWAGYKGEVFYSMRRLNH
jgi:hypothetical protein